MSNFDICLHYSSYSCILTLGKSRTTVISLFSVPFLIRYNILFTILASGNILLWFSHLFPDHTNTSELIVLASIGIIVLTIDQRVKYMPLFTHLYDLKRFACDLTLPALYFLPGTLVYFVESLRSTMCSSKQITMFADDCNSSFKLLCTDRQ